MSHRRQKRARKAIRLTIMTAVSFDASLAAHLAIAADPAPTAAEPANSADDLSEIVVTGVSGVAELRLGSQAHLDPADRVGGGRRPRQNARPRRCGIIGAAPGNFDQSLGRQRQRKY